ncbi:MAG: tellurite resistance TerB family protein [Elusimicrobiota bacterium]
MKNKGCAYGKVDDIKTMDDAITAISILAISSDGKISKKEVDMIENMLRVSPIYENIRPIKLYIDCVYNLVMKNTRDEVIKKSVKLIPERLRPTVFGWIYMIVKSDKKLTQSEHRFMDEVFKELKINGNLAGKIKAVCEILLRSE